MKRICLLVLHFIWSLLLFSAYQSKPTTHKLSKGLQVDYDFSGVDQFLLIVDSLEMNKEVSEASWQQLFETDGYKALNNDQYIQYNIREVFTPNRKAKLDTLLNKAGYWRKRDLEHLITVRQNISELKEFRHSFNIDQFIATGREKALNYLPNYLDSIYTTPPLRFVIFSPDARVMGGTIIFDLQFVMDMKGEELSNLIGHEFHHYYLSFVKGRMEGPERDQPLYNIYRPIKQLQIEGVADLIDKRNVVSDSIKLKWMDAYYSSNEKLKFMNDKLEELAESSDSLSSYGKAIFNNFPINCHPNGFYMAELIEQHFGKQEIIKTLSNHFQFFYSYNLAATNNINYYAFPKKSIQYLKKLEQQITLNFGE